MDLRSHSFLASHLHTAATNGSDLLVGLSVVVVCSLMLFAIVWLLRGGADDDSGPSHGDGGGGPRTPDRPQSGPSWWPDFEREFARYAAGRRDSPDLVGAVDRERVLVPPGT